MRIELREISVFLKVKNLLEGKGREEALKPVETFIKETFIQNTKNLINLSKNTEEVLKEN